MIKNRLIKNISITTVLTLALCQTLEANDDRVLKLTLTDSAKIYSEALEAYKKRDFKISFSKFSIYSEKKSLNKSDKFIYARSAYEVGELDIAVKYYKEILQEEPTNQRTKLELAQCYFRQAKYDESKELYDEVLKGEIPQSVRNNILLTLKALEQKNKKSYFSAVAALGIIYDSNVNNGSQSDYDIYLNNVAIPMTGVKEQSDYSVQVVGVLNNSYNLSESKKIESKAVLLNQSYKKYHDKNINLLSLESALSYYSKTSKQSLAFGYDRIELNNNDFLTVYKISPRYSKKIDNDLIYQSFFNFSKKRYMQSSDKGRDSTVYEILNSLSLNTKDYGNNSLSLSLGKEVRDKNERTDVSKSYYNLNYSNSYPLGNKFTLTNSILYEKTNYKYENSFFLSKREESKKSYSIGLQKVISDKLSVNLNLQLIDNISNHEPYDYSKEIFKAYLYYSF